MNVSAKGTFQLNSASCPVVTRAMEWCYALAYSCSMCGILCTTKCKHEVRYWLGLSAYQNKHQVWIVVLSFTPLMQAAQCGAAAACLTSCGFMQKCCFCIVITQSLRLACQASGPKWNLGLFISADISPAFCCMPV